MLFALSIQRFTIMLFLPKFDAELMHFQDLEHFLRAGFVPAEQVFKHDKRLCVDL